jgi:hypothetical protein
MSELSFEMHSGDSRIIQLVATDQDDNIVDLTGATIRWQAARSAYSKTPLLQKHVGSGVTITFPAAGVFEVQLLPADTDNLVGALYHESDTANWGTITLLKDLVD